MEFLSKSNAKKLASFAETPPKITTISRKNGKMEKWKNGFFIDGERNVHRQMKLFKKAHSGRYVKD